MSHLAIDTLEVPIQSSSGYVFDFPVRPSKRRPKGGSDTPAAHHLSNTTQATRHHVRLPAQMMRAVHASVFLCCFGMEAQLGVQTPPSKLQPNIHINIKGDLFVLNFKLTKAPGCKGLVSRPPHSTPEHSRATLRSIDHAMYPLALILLESCWACNTSKEPQLCIQAHQCPSQRCPAWMQDVMRAASLSSRCTFVPARRRPLRPRSTRVFERTKDVVQLQASKASVRMRLGRPWKCEHLSLLTAETQIMHKTCRLVCL